MFSSFNAKFRQDLEIIYAKYSTPFEGAPELTLSTCELPKNVKLIEGYEYSDCGKWKLLQGNSDDPCDSSLVEGSLACEFTSDEESQSSYDSDNSLSSDGSGYLHLEKSFREKYPRSCAKTSTSTLLKSVSPTNMVNTTRSSDKSHDLVRKKLNGNHEDERTDSDMILNKNAGYSVDEVQNFKSGNGTVTLSKDLWSQVQQCLRLMTSVFTQLNSDGENTHDLESDCDEKPSQQEFSQKSLIKSSLVKQKLFHDEKTSGANVPQGEVVEKLFVRRKGTSGPGVQLASRKSFLRQSTSQICELKSVDSAFCHENSSASHAPQHPQFKSSKNTSDLGQELPERKRRRRYRLVRRRSSKTRQESTSEPPPQESDTGYQEPCPRKRQSFVPSVSDSENIPEKTKSTIFDEESVRCDSPDMDEVKLIEAPPTPGVLLPRTSSQIRESPRNRLVTESNEEPFRSSTPRKQMYSGINNTATKSLDPDAYLKKSSSKKRANNAHKDSMPSPIRSAFNSNTHLTETSSVCHSFTSNLNNSSLLSSKSQNTSRNSLPNPISPKSTKREIFQPEISVNFLKKKDIPKARPVSNEKILEHRSSHTQNGYTEKLFPCSSAATKRRSPGKLKRDNHDRYTSASSDNQSVEQRMTPRRAKFHPYAAHSKFPRPSSLSSPFRDLSIKSPSSYNRWTTLDRSPLPICVTKARRVSGSASRKILELGPHDACRESSPKKTTPKSRDEMKNENSSRPESRKNLSTEQPTTNENDDSACSDCSSAGKCTKIFCFNCSMNLS